MGSIFREDKIGVLSEAGGTISLAASLITIGGRQFETLSSIGVAIPSIEKNSRYQVYAVNNSGTVELVISQNENSVGPTGWSNWKLVGSFWTNGLQTAAFNNFMSIDAPPQAVDVPYFPVTANFGTITVASFFYSISNGILTGYGQFNSGAPTGGGAQVHIPDNLRLSENQGTFTIPVGFWSANQVNSSKSGNLNAQEANSETALSFGGATITSSQNDSQTILGNQVSIGVNQAITVGYTVVIRNWKTQAIKDL